MAIPPSGKTEMIAANRARAAANRETRSGEKQTETKDNKTNTNKADRNLRYPYAMLDSNTDYLKIDIATYSPPGLNLSDKDKGAVVENEDPTTKKKFQTVNKNFSLETGSNVNSNIIKQAKHTIILPIPQQLSDTSAISWGDAGLNALEAFGVSVTQGVMTQGLAGIEQALNVVRDNAGGVLLSEDVRKAVAAALSGEAIGLIGGNVSGSQLVSRATGQVFNPNLELLFEGVNIRSFPFSFEFFPRNPTEADQVKRIIRTFKKSMSARKSGNTADIFIGAPDVFQLTFMKGGSKHPFLNRFLPMALTNMNLSYTGSNTYSTFYDGTPTHMKLDLTFKELNPIYFEDYEALEQAKDTSVGY